MGESGREEQDLSATHKGAFPDTLKRRRKAKCGREVPSIASPLGSVLSKSPIPSSDCLGKQAASLLSFDDSGISSDGGELRVCCKSKKFGCRGAFQEWEERRSVGTEPYREKPSSAQTHRCNSFFNGRRRTSRHRAKSARAHITYEKLAQQTKRHRIGEERDFLQSLRNFTQVSNLLGWQSSTLLPGSPSVQSPRLFKCVTVVTHSFSLNSEKGDDLF